MLDIFSVFLIIIVAFFVILLIKVLIKKEFCAICAAVSLTWVFLIVLNKMSLFDDKTFIAVLMGQSVLGIFYLAEKKAANNLKFFRLPFLLSLTFLAYFVIGEFVFSVAKLLLALWLFFLAIFLYRHNAKVNVFVEKIIACCKWG